VDAALRAHQVFKLRYRIGSAAEVRRVIESTGRLNIDPITRQQRVVGVARDVTDEVNQARLSLQRDAAEKVTQAQREFLSRLSHELRTPLNAILGFAQLILMDPARELDPIQTRRVNLVLTAGRQLLTLVEDVLDLSKVEAGEIAVVPQDVELVQVLRACTTLVDSARERLNITLIDRLPHTPLWARADPHRIQQVLINLLTNACKYNRPNGHVTLEARTEGGDAVIDIIDNGIGLSPDDLAELFQPFRRFGPTTQVEGTGLGLYIVKQLVERMGGSVSASSDKGLGSCFTVRLPRAQR
jgi:signal transduction histidine kinase